MKKEEKKGKNEWKLHLKHIKARRNEEKEGKKYENKEWEQSE